MVAMSACYTENVSQNLIYLNYHLIKTKELKELNSKEL